MTVVRSGSVPPRQPDGAPDNIAQAKGEPQVSSTPQNGPIKSTPSDQFETQKTAVYTHATARLELETPPTINRPRESSTQLHRPPTMTETIESKGGFLSGLKDFLGFGESVNNQVNPQMDLSYALYNLGHSDSVLGRATLRGEPKEVRLRTAAHLLGVGGQLGNPKVRLEGLSRNEASKTLDPIFREALELTRSLVAQSSEHKEFSKVLHQQVKSFREPTSHSRFMHDIQVALREPSGTADHPCTWMTGWRSPSGHAVGLVFDRVEGQNRIYLSNAGDDAFEGGETVKGFEVADLQQFQTALRASNRDDQLVRKLWHKEGMALWGLKSLKGDAQLPDKLQRSYQKRGNCPLASRKGCVLAAMWSRRPTDNPASDVKKTYKIFTTLLRRQGMELALRENNTELIKRSFVAMVGKSDRPDCLRLLYRAADQLAENHGLFALEENWDKLESERLRDEPYLGYLKSVIQRAGIDIDQPDESGLSPYERAKALDRDELKSFIKKLRD